MNVVDTTWYTYEYLLRLQMSAEEFGTEPMIPGNSALIILLLVGCLISQATSKGGNNNPMFETI
jgi:hypothetical protein